MVRGDSTMCMGVIAIVAMVMLAGCGRGAGTMNIEPEPTQPEPTQPTDPEPMQFEWRLVTERTGGVLNDVAWGGERFVAVGDDGVIWHSTDADIWMRAHQTLGIVLGVSEVYGGVAWSGTRFVAIAGAGLAGTRVAYSSDGDIWDGVYDFLGAGIDRCEPCRFHGITWDGARFVAVGAGGEIVHSTDGDTWTEASHSATSRNLHGVAGSGTRFVAVGGAIVASP